MQTGTGQRQRGVSLIELMVALVISLFLLLGAVTVFNQSQSTYRASESVARLQETARLAMDVVETDIRMAKFLGMNNRPEYILNRAGPGQSAPAGLTAQQQSNASLCGAANNNWIVNLDEYIGGSNNAYGLTCAGSNYRAGTDVVIIRRANEAAPVAFDTNRVYLQTSRIQGTLFVPPCTDPTSQACIPAAYLPPASQSRALEAHAYYVSSQSTQRTDVPALRRKRLANISATTATDAVIDEEIAPGVEDMQIRLGIDTNGDTSADQYVEPGAVPANANVVSATVWLLIRADDPDVSFRPTAIPAYADKAAVTPTDRYRRILVSKTIHIRNTRA